MSGDLEIRQVASWLWPRRIERSPNDQKSGDGTVHPNLLEAVRRSRYTFGKKNDWSMGSKERRRAVFTMPQVAQLLFSLTPGRAANGFSLPHKERSKSR
jgi:hypothetical protein